MIRHDLLQLMLSTSGTQFWLQTELVAACAHAGQEFNTDDLTRQFIDSGQQME